MLEEFRKVVFKCLFYRWYSGGNKSAGAIVPPVDDSVSGMTQYKDRDRIVRKTLSCSCNG